jgi:hypothetical protein
LRGVGTGGIIVARGDIPVKKPVLNRSALRLAVAAVIATAILTACCDCGFEPTTMEGTWAGVVSDNYYCEGGSYPIEIDVSGSTITVTGGFAFTTGTTGTLTNQAGEAYTVMMDLAEAGEGQMFVDPGMNYAFFIVHGSDATYDYLIGVLQKGTLASFTCEDSDLVGDWAGTSVRVNAGLGVTATSASSATMYESAGVVLDGTDGDGDFSGLVTVDPFATDAGVYEGSADWPPSTSYGVRSWLSFDKNAMAVAFLNDTCHYTLADDLPAQKFAIWVKQ